jgi:predicted  nucleic acid-binding Zn ribbon protein
MKNKPYPIPQDELCSCSPNPPVKLMSALGNHPIHCVNCNLAVPLERLALTESLVNTLVHWQRLYNAIDLLWLDSGEYEEWARQQLSDIHSYINRLGRKAQQELNPIYRCYYWYFQDESASDYTPFIACPVCGQRLQDYPNGIFKQRICEACGIIGVGE